MQLNLGLSWRPVFVALAITLMIWCFAVMQAHASPAVDKRVPDQYIVVLKDGVDDPPKVAQAQAARVDARPEFVYQHAIKGYSVMLSKQALSRLRRNPQVKYVVPDIKVDLFEQSVPTGLARVSAETNPALAIDEEDDIRVDVDVAVIDTGIDIDHPDLDVVERTDCVPENGEPSELCIDDQGDDGHSHGTHVAGTIAAIDNSIGVVGSAPGARLWAVRAVADNGSAHLSWIIGAVDWVTAHASEIEVANMSLGATGVIPVMNEAVQASVEAGVVYVVAAGNADRDAADVSPASSPYALTVSALADYDGEAGGNGESTCNDYGPDDSLASFSNWGDTVDVIAPGVCIKSTMPGGGVGVKSGTSMASPLAAGAAAVLASEANPETAEDVKDIHKALIDGGSLSWVDAPSDSSHEPLVHMGGEPLEPEVVTSAVTDRDVEGFTLAGAIAARGQATSYSFEFGTSEAYGSSMPVTPLNLDPGTGYAKIEVPLVGLDKETTYHYRLVATNASGTLYGQDMKTTTLADPPEFAESISLGGEFEFESFIDVTVSPDGHLYVIDTENGRVHQLSLDGEHLQSWGEAGTGPGQFSTPLTGIAADPGGGVWVADFGERLQRFSASGEYVTMIEKEGAAFVDVAVGEDGKIYATDFDLQGVRAFDANGQQLFTVSSGWPFDPGGFSDPIGVDVTDSGTLWVADSDLNRVQKFDSAGEFVTEFGEYGFGPGSFFEVRGVASEPGGGAATVDVSAGGQYLQRFNASGEFLTSFTDSGGGPGELLSPEGIDVDSAGNIWVADTGNDRVQRWSYRRPLVMSGEAARVDAREAELRVSVNPEEHSTEYWFEYGTAGYDEKTAVGSVGSGASGVVVGDEVFNLTPETTYYYRAVASNENGVTYGSPRTFVTLSSEGEGSWTAQSTPNPQAKAESRFADVSCASPSMCMGVGRDDAQGKAFVEHWDGEEWSIISAVASAQMSAISCPSTTACTIVGETDAGQARIWGIQYVGMFGIEWKAPAAQTVATPSEGSQVKIADVACTSAEACTAVGHYTKAGVGIVALAERWNGSSWSVQSVPSPAESETKKLAGVSCPAASVCVAAGSYGAKVGGSYKDRPLVARWEGGSWSLQSAPNPSGATESGLADVSCASSASCMAVGALTEGETIWEPFSERFSSGSWTAHSVPAAEGALSSPSPVLASLSCPSTTYCVAAGTYYTGEFPWQAKTLVAAWVEGEWTIQESSDPHNQNSLEGVSCSASDACTAVGVGSTQAYGGESVTLAERWE